MLLKEIKILNENVQLPEHVVAYIHEHCQPYLQAVGNDLSAVLYRGITKRRLSRLQEVPGLSNCAIISGHHESRDPLDTPTVYHDMANEIFTELYGAPFRNGIFATGSLPTAKGYGSPVAIFPIGDFKFCWSSTVVDMSNLVAGNVDYYEGDHNKEEETNFIHTLRTQYSNKNLKAAIESKKEVMLYCDSCLVYVAV